MLISNLTDSVFRPMLSSTSRSTSPVWNGSGAAAPKSRGIGGKFLLLAGECDRRGESSGCSVAELSSAWTVGAFDDTLKKEDEPLLCVALNVAGGPPEGRPGSSFSFSFSLCVVVVPFTLVSPPRSLSLLLTPKDSFDALRTIRLVVPPESPEPPEPCLRCFRGDGVGVAGGSCSDEMSIEGRCMQSNPVLVSLYCTCMRSNTRLMSALIVAGGFVDVVATLSWHTERIAHEYTLGKNSTAFATYLNRPFRNNGLNSLSAALAFASSSASVSSCPASAPAPFTRPCLDGRPDASSSGTSAVCTNGRSGCKGRPPAVPWLVDGRRWRPIVPVTLERSAPPVLLRRSCRFACPCGSRIVAARRCSGCAWLCEIPPVGDTCISTFPSSEAAGAVLSPAAGEAAVGVVGLGGSGSGSVFSLSGEPACVLSLSRSFSETPLSMSAEGRGDPKPPRMLVRLELRSPAARTLPAPPISKLPNLRTSVAPGDVVGVAGDNTTSGGGLGAGAAISVCSSSIRSANVVSSGPAVRGTSCPLMLTLSCPCSPIPALPPPPPPPPPNMLAQPRGTF